MKFYLFPILIFLLSSCKDNINIFDFPPKHLSRNAFRITKQIIEYFDKNQVDTILFYYKKNNDFFPYLIETKNQDTVITVSKFYFNEWDVPYLEEQYYGDSIVQKVYYSYSPKNYYLIEKTVLDNKNIKKYSEKYDYFSNNKLNYVEFIYFSKDEKFLNVDSNNISEFYHYKVLPDTLLRYEGKFAPYLFLGFYKKYSNISAIPKNNKISKKISNFEFISTDFDEFGYPKKQKFYRSDTLWKIIWYEKQTDGLGQVRHLIPYKDSLFTNIDKDHYSLYFSYSNEGLVNYVSKNYFNVYKKKFASSDTIITYEYFLFDENNPQNYLYLFTSSKLFYYDRSLQSYYVKETKVTKFEADEIILEYYEYPSNLSKKLLSNLKPNKRVKMLIEKIKLKHYKGL